jgi:hypothetical protein
MNDVEYPVFVSQQSHVWRGPGFANSELMNYSATLAASDVALLYSQEFNLICSYKEN